MRERAWGSCTSGGDLPVTEPSQQPRPRPCPHDMITHSWLLKYKSELPDTSCIHTRHCILSSAGRSVCGFEPLPPALTIQQFQWAGWRLVGCGVGQGLPQVERAHAVPWRASSRRRVDGPRGSSTARSCSRHRHTRPQRRHAVPALSEGFRRQRACGVRAVSVSAAAGKRGGAPWGF